MKVTILGCGGSMGVPHATGNWGVCDPDDPRNRRRRTSILVERAGTAILVDTGPDLREQLIDARVKSLDAVLWTHAHADHVHGVDDLRAIHRETRRDLPVYGDAETLNRMITAFPYLFKMPSDPNAYYRPYLSPHEITGPFEIAGVPIVPFVQDHGFSNSLGFRFGPVAYSTDVAHLSEEAFAILEGVEIWIVGAVREEPHPTHAHLARALGWIERVKPRRAYLTHMGYEVDYVAYAAKCPNNVEPAYDGLVIESSRD